MTTRATFVSDLIATAPVAAWHLDEASGAVAADYVDTHPGAYGGTFTLNQAGVFSDGPAIHLNGGYMQVAGLFSWASGFAPVSVWMKADAAAPAVGATIFHVGTVGANGWLVFQNAGNAALLIGRPGIGSLGLGCSIPDANWHWWVFGGGSNPGAFAVFRDGVQVAAIPNPSNNPASQTFTLGADSDGSGGFRGYMSEAAIWSGGLDAPTILGVWNSYLYSAGGAAPPVPAGLAGLDAKLDLILASVRKIY